VSHDYTEDDIDQEFEGHPEEQDEEDE